jgi:hypothetical protein
MTDSGFLVTLPSNSNMSTHPSNEPANYTVKLAEPLQLEGEWEAALVSVQYTPSWMSLSHAIKLVVVHSEFSVRHMKYPAIYRSDASTINDIHSLALYEVNNEIAKDTDFTLITERVALSCPTEVIKICRATIQPKYYDSVESLGAEICKVIEDVLQSDKVCLRYIYDANLKRGQFINHKGEISIYTEDSNILGDLLGHKQSPVNCVCKNHNYYRLFLHGTAEPKLPVVNTMWIYTDITEMQQVGDSKVPLLGVIPAHSLGRRREHYPVNPVHFQALSRNHISEITIQIADDRGRRIPFVIGANEDSLVCCLRFRRRKTVMSI